VRPEQAGSATSRSRSAPHQLVRVTVTSETRRVDLSLPGAVPVAELLPELARCVGLLRPTTAHAGYRLVTVDGRTLAASIGLRQQDVVDGALLAVVAGVDEEVPRVYDDVVEAMADVVECDVAPWSEEARQRAASVAVVVLLLAGAAFLSTQRGSALAVSSAVTLASVLVLGSAALSRSTRASGMPPVAMLGCVYAAVAGWLVAEGPIASGAPIACAGAGALTAGTAAFVGLARARILLLPAVTVGMSLSLVGVVVRATPMSPALVSTAVMSLVVIAGNVFPRWAWHVVGGHSYSALLGAESSGPVLAIDAERVRSDARLGHEILAALSASAGAVLMFAAPEAVTLGVAGTLVPVLASVIVMLRTRQCRAGTEVLVGLCSGGLGLISTAGSVLCLHPGWRWVAALVLEVSGVVMLVMSHPRRHASIRRGRASQIVESVALLLLPATLVVASGHLPVLRP
jgi:ESX secretion system protein EccD